MTSSLDVRFEVKVVQLTKRLEAQFAEAHRLEIKIIKGLKGVCR